MNVPLRGLGPLYVLLCVLLAACASAPPQRYYTLSAIAAPAQAAAAAGAGMNIVVAPVTLPGTLDRPQLVARVAPNRVQLLDQERWAEPLKDQIARVMAGNLARELPGARVQTSRDSTGRADGSPQWRLMMDIRQLELSSGDAVTLEALWTLRPVPAAAAGTTGTGAARSGHVLLREPVQGAGLEAAVAAHDRALARMSTEVASALRQSQSNAP